MELHTIEEMAKEIGRNAVPARNRPAEEGDLLYMEEVSARTPIRLDTWEMGCWGSQLPALDTLVDVVGCHDDLGVGTERTGRNSY